MSRKRRSIRVRRKALNISRDLVSVWNDAQDFEVQLSRFADKVRRVGKKEGETDVVFAAKLVKKAANLMNDAADMLALEER